MQWTVTHYLYCALLLLLLYLPDTQADDLLLANIYTDNITVSDYWISEKLDGVRAYWDGKQLLTRKGNSIHAPDWFTQGFPERPLDGELWIGRSQFEQTLSTVRKQHAVDSEWRQVRYMLFELPAGEGDFSTRLAHLQQIVSQSGNPRLQLIPQFSVENRKALKKLMARYVAEGAEGLMLHRKAALYHGGRSDDLLKLKPYLDAEAVVIAHLPGKGRNEGRLGALQVEMPNGKRFKIGTGFTDQQRQQPPPIGSRVTYKYHGLTRNGIPRFASFLRRRPEE